MGLEGIMLSVIIILNKLNHQLFHPLKQHLSISDLVHSTYVTDLGKVTVWNDDFAPYLQWSSHGAIAYVQGINVLPKESTSSSLGSPGGSVCVQTAVMGMYFWPSSSSASVCNNSVQLCLSEPYQAVKNRNSSAIWRHLVGFVLSLGGRGFNPGVSDQSEV